MSFVGHLRREPFKYILFPTFLAVFLLFAVFYKPENPKPNAPSDKNVEQPLSPAEARKVATDDALAAYTKWLMIFTAVLAVSTLGLWITTRKGMRDQARDMKDSVAASRDAVAASQAELISTQRAWLKTELVMPDEFFISQSEDQTGLFFFIKMKNVGSAIALNARYEAWFCCEEDEAKRGRWLTQKCNTHQASPPPLYGHNIFPGESLPSSDFENYVLMAYCDRAELNEMIAKNGGPIFKSIHIGGYVGYSFPTDVNTIRESRFSYFLYTQPDKGFDINGRQIKNGVLTKDTYAIGWHVD